MDVSLKHWPWKEWTRVLDTPADLISVYGYSITMVPVGGMHTRVPSQDSLTPNVAAESNSRL